MIGRSKNPKKNKGKEDEKIKSNDVPESRQTTKREKDSRAEDEACV
jgi:hypothetical protein